LARVTPGTNLLAFCAGAAWGLRGWPAAILAVSAVTLPAAALIVLLSQGYQSWQSNRIAMAAINGTLAAAVGMMLSGAWQLVRPLAGFRAAVICGASLALSIGLGASPIPVLAGAALVGLVWRR
jgi:chromate transporter